MLLRGRDDRRRDVPHHHERIELGIVRRIADGEPTARAHLDHGEARLLAHRRGEREDAVDRFAIGPQLGDLRSDVRVEAAQLERGLREDRPDAGLRRATLDVESELRVRRPGREMRMCVHVDARPEAQEHLLPRPARRDPAEKRDLVEVVHDDASDAELDSGVELVLTLVVAVEVDALARELRRARDVELAP